jgi:hypothetical protein
MAAIFLLILAGVWPSLWEFTWLAVSGEPTGILGALIYDGLVGNFLKASSDAN